MTASGESSPRHHVPRRNRVDPWGDLHAVPDRGRFTGNRGCLVDDAGTVVRHHAGVAWIICTLRYQDHRSPLASPRHWTPLFFLDDAVALAAGHRPCARCRPQEYRSYRDAVTASLGRPEPARASDLDRLLGSERLGAGRGLDRSSDRITWRAPYRDLPRGAVVVGEEGRPHLVLQDHLRPFTFAGWGPPTSRPAGGSATVLTPPTSCAALTLGFTPVLST